MKKLNVKDLLEKYIIVVDGDEKKVVYDANDSRIFSVHITGCGRGARNAALNSNTFKSMSKAFRDIEYLSFCHFSYKFKILKFSELQNFSTIGFDYLLKDIASYNESIDFKIKNKQERQKQEKENYLKLLNLTKKAIEQENIDSIKEDSEIITVTFFKSKITN